jgi:predicted metal-dependent hydrolase
LYLKKFSFLKEKEINIESIGRVLLKKSSRAKYLSIKIKPDVGISVTIPKRVSFIEGERFTIKNKDWILKHIHKITKAEKSKIIFDEFTHYETKFHKLVITSSLREKTRVKIANSLIYVEIAKNIDVQSEETQDIIKCGIIKTLRIEANDYIPNRLAELAEQFGFSYNKVFLKNLRSRWGSCSGKNNINLNIHLMKTPYELIDYVILHELVHTVHKNHSKKFWAHLESVCPNSKKYDKKLKRYAPNIF